MGYSTEITALQTQIRWRTCVRWDNYITMIWIFLIFRHLALYIIKKKFYSQGQYLQRTPFLHKPLFETKYSRISSTFLWKNYPLWNLTKFNFHVLICVCIYLTLNDDNFIKKRMIESGQRISLSLKKYRNLDCTPSAVNRRFFWHR